MREEQGKEDKVRDLEQIQHVKLKVHPHLFPAVKGCSEIKKPKQIRVRVQSDPIHSLIEREFQIQGLNSDRFTTISRPHLPTMKIFNF